MNNECSILKVISNYVILSEPILVPSLKQGKGTLILISDRY